MPGRNYVAKKMGTADLIAIVSFSTSRTVVQDFTNDRARLTAAWRA